MFSLGVFTLFKVIPVKILEVKDIYLGLQLESRHEVLVEIDVCELNIWANCRYLYFWMSLVICRYYLCVKWYSRGFLLKFGSYHKMECASYCNKGFQIHSTSKQFSKFVVTEIFTDHLAVGNHYTRGYQSSCRKVNVRQNWAAVELRQ